MTELEELADIFNKMNNEEVTLGQWIKASDYAKKDLKRKVEVCVDKIMEEIRWVIKTQPDTQVLLLRLEDWMNIKKELEKL